MDKIVELIKDPSWWFSALFISIVTSLLAAFLKDWFSKLLSHFSKTYRLHRYKNLRKTVHTIQNIEKDQGYLTYFSIMHFSLIILIVVMLVSYMALLPSEGKTFMAQTISKVMILLSMLPLALRFLNNNKTLQIGLRRYKFKNKLHDVNKDK